MSTYAVHSLCWRIRKDEALREELRGDPRRVLARFRLSDAEREALLAGDVATLERMGAHGYLLANLGRFGLLGLDRESYARRIKGLR
ncbi:MAG: hypothetical protein E6I20_10315 [Chloroflexi bacterium]|nr:MAG: hypothetical protein E6I20_10315 [Chloroflexota bacterium]